ncbi:hypothetical protein NQZ79_g5404 [Umbelopsis isabellina]|nr:hypothetical protein NQZ79_g5404 [Umbelopsis isabellina]
MERLIKLLDAGGGVIHSTQGMPPKRKRSTEVVSATTDKEISKFQDIKSWPTIFIQYLSLFKALNVLFGFLEGRVSSTTLSLSSVKSSVDGSYKLTEQGLTIEDVAALGFISPGMVRCRKDEDGEIMVDFGPAKAKKKSDITKDRDKLPPKIIKMSDIPKLIERREKAFIEAVVQVLKKCDKKNLDPVQALENGKVDFLPDPPSSPTLNRQPSTQITERPFISNLLEQIKDAPFYEEQLVPEGRRTWPERNPKYGELNVTISPVIWKALSSTRSITTLYCHQAEAINALCDGEDVIVTTSTASGKSLIYQIPVLDALLKDKNSKAMYIFPTKALAQDQLRSLQDIISACEGIEDVKTSTFDGDTPSEHRRHIRETANIIFTNPDMLHHSILPNFLQWSHFLENLKFVVVDELHVYNGLFGSNVALIMRRLRRLCHLVGNYDVRFASCSATIGNAAQVTSHLYMLKRVMSYRGGYTPQDRRRIERQMFSGELLGVIATNALELGVDIGSLDAVMMLGVPWSISAMWQQSGRAGRRNNDSLSLLVASENPMDQFYMNHPDELYSQPMSDTVIDIENPITLEGHLQCAALEKPIDLSTDLVYFGQSAESICMEHLRRDPSDPFYRCHPRFLPTPSKFVSIRSTTEETYTVVDVTNGKHIIIEEVEANRVPFELYEGAIFIHQGVTYLVDECNVDQCYARIRRVNVDWITRQRDFTDVDANDVERSRLMTEGQRLFYGKLKVSTHVYGYYKVDKRNHILDAVDVYMDPIVRNSNGLWVDVPIRALKDMAELDINVAASIHAAGHLLVSMIPTFAYSPVGDVRTECKSPLAKRQRPARISLYEPEACGTTGRAYPVFERLLHAAYETITTCKCKEGCPQSPYVQDRWGRRVSMSGGSLGLAVAAIIIGLTPTATGFWAGRVVLGIGQAFVYAAPTYMSEIASRDARGRIVGVWQITWAIGALISTLIALGAQNDAAMGEWQWRLVQPLQLILPTFFAVGIWLVHKDRIDEARQALARLQSDKQLVEEELKDEKENTTKISFREVLIDKSLRHRLLIACFLNLFIQVCGNNAMNTFGSKIYQAAFTSNSIALIMTAIQDVVQILGAGIAILWVDRFGRRKALIGGAIVMELMLILAGSLPVGYGASFPQHKAAAIVMVIFPLNVRTQLVGVSSQFQKIGYCLWVKHSRRWFNVFMAIIVYFYLSETKGISLEEMDAIFGGVNRVKEQMKKDALASEVHCLTPIAESSKVAI